MHKTVFMFILGLILILLAGPSLAQGHHRIGAGLHYWRTVDEIADAWKDSVAIDESGVSWILSYQYSSNPLITFEADILIMPETYGAAEDGYRVWGPQAMLLVGHTIYAGMGVGIYRAGDEWAPNPFFPLRAGIDLEILPKLSLDINGNYRIEKWNMHYTKEDVDTDTVTLGAIVRVSL